MDTGDRRLVADLSEALAEVPCINTHSHVTPERQWLERDMDALTYFQHAYPASDLQSAGMSPDDLAYVTDPSGPLPERWARFEPYWRRARLTGFSRCILEGWSATYGVEELTADTVGPLSSAIRASRRPGFYYEVLHDRANIAISMMQMEDLVEVDRSLFLPMPRLNRFSMVHSRADLEAIERDYSFTISGLGDLVEAIRSVCGRWKAVGAPAVKLSQSYHRRMDFQERREDDAARVFLSILEGSYHGLESQEGRLLEDYLVYACCRAAADAGLVVQFHVGPRAGTYGRMEGTSLAPMVNLFRTHPDARFDISHAGFPYLSEAGVVAKTFPNVYLDMSWIHVYSPRACQEALKEWLRALPWSKVLAFGDDVAWVDVTYGHLVIARRNVAVALAGLVEEDLVDRSEALEIGRGLFHDNPAAVYSLRV